MVIKKQSGCSYKRGMRVAVLCGGASPEREVSIKSGERVADALRRRGYRVAIVDPIERYAENQMRFFGGACFSALDRKRRERHCKRNKRGKSLEFTASALRFCQKADVVFLALHGGAGEDGRIAAVLECMGIPHTGSDHKGLCVSMDKAISKRIMEQVGIKTPEGIVLDCYKGGVQPSFEHFPCVVKPTCGGSSIGVKMAENEKELGSILSDIRNENIMIERKIIGREFTVGVLCGEALAVTEIIPRVGFYDYKNKYTRGATEEITPAHISKESERELRNTAIATHKALCLGAYSRIDMIIEKETEQIYVLEANALPGMTETSLLPQGAAAVGIDFDTLCEKMLLCALGDSTVW